MSTQYITCQEILDAYKTHGNNFMEIDIKSHRTSANNDIKYFSIHFIKSDNTKVLSGNIKFINQSVSHVIDKGINKLSITPDDLFDMAMSITCNTFSEKITQMADVEIQLFNPFSKIVTPMHNIEHYKRIYWFLIPFKKDSQNLFGPKNYALDFYNLNVLDDNNYPVIENIDSNNITKFVMRNSKISGVLNMSIIASSKSISLNTKFTKSLYVNNKDVQTNKNTYFDTNDFSEMM